jgi:hypothetical protein
MPTGDINTFGKVWSDAVGWVWIDAYPVAGTTYIPMNPPVHRRRRRIIIIEEEEETYPVYPRDPFFPRPTRPWEWEPKRIPWGNEQPCMHKSCSECHGSGRKANGSVCIHMISCPCLRCSPRCY